MNLDKILKTKKKKINSGTKGRTFQRGICKILNEFFNTKEFCPTPGSGAFATTHNLPEHLQVYGDIITPKNFPFVIECKKGYNEIGITDIFKKNSKLKEFFSQVQRDALRAKKHWCVIFKQDKGESIVIYNPFDINKNDFNLETLGLQITPRIDFHIDYNTQYRAIKLSEFLTCLGNLTL